MIQVRFIVEPLSIYKSGAPMISVEGSKREKREKVLIKKMKLKEFYCGFDWNKITIS